jgi:hypothetical protein
MTTVPTDSVTARRSLRAPVLWGLVFGGLQAASPVARSYAGPSCRRRQR